MSYNLSKSRRLKLKEYVHRVIIRYEKDKLFQANAVVADTRV